MKIFEFINIIADAFATEIMPDSETGKVTDKLIYETVLTWFISYDADEKELVRIALVKSPNYCNKILNGNVEKDMPISDARFLKGKINSEGFEDVFDSANLEDDAIKGLIRKFMEKGESISDFDIVQDISDVLYKLLDERSAINKKGSIRKAEFLGNDKVRIGSKIISLPKPLMKPNLPTSKETLYVTALLEVYAQKVKKGSLSLSELDSEPIYREEFQLHRECFYSAEGVLYQIRDFFNDAEREFINMKNEIYNAVKFNINKPHNNGYDRLNSTMDTVLSIKFTKPFLSSQGNGIIGVDEQRGMVHMLVNEGNIIWIKEYDYENI